MSGKPSKKGETARKLIRSGITNPVDIAKGSGLSLKQVERILDDGIVVVDYEAVSEARKANIGELQSTLAGWIRQLKVSRNDEERETLLYQIEKAQYCSRMLEKEEGYASIRDYALAHGGKGFESATMITALVEGKEF